MGLLAALLTARSAGASCECVLVVESTEFIAHCYQTCGYADSSDPGGGWRGVTECHARALRFAANLRERLGHDDGLRGLARRTRLAFGREYGWGDSLGPEDWRAPAGLPTATVDSLLAVFRGIDRDSSAGLFTVQLGIFRQRSRADSLWRDLDYLRPAEDTSGDPDQRDATLAVDLRLWTCAYTFRPNLFVWPASAVPGAWSVCYGLFVDRGDAVRTADHLRGFYKLDAVTRSLPLSMDLLQAAVGQWHLSGMSDLE